MAESPVLLTVSERVATITLNRPDSLNGLSRDLLPAFLAAVKRAADDASVRAVLVTGAGKAFCAGADVKEFQAAATKGPEAAGELVLHFTNHLHEAILRMKRTPKLFVAAINGAVAGGGLGIALSCDVRIASDNARFVAGYDKLNVSPDGGSTILVPHLAGGGRAIDLLVAGRPISAEEAHRFGLVSEVVPQSQLLGKAMEQAKECAALARDYCRNAKELLYPKGLEERLKEEQRRTVESVKTRDFAEGVKAFLEKRAPKFA